MEKKCHTFRSSEHIFHRCKITIFEIIEWELSSLTLSDIHMNKYHDTLSCVQNIHVHIYLSFSSKTLMYILGRYLTPNMSFIPCHQKAYYGDSITILSGCMALATAIKSHDMEKGGLF